MQETSAEPGPWSTSRAEYQRDILDACTDSRNRRVVFHSSSQVGKTEIINNLIAYYAKYDPCAMLCVHPTLPTAQNYSRVKLDSMINAMPILTDLFNSKRSKDGSNTILEKTFPGGSLMIVGANAPSALASKSVRIVCLDEIDRYPRSAGKEGNPVKLAERRSMTFFNSLVVLTSTPTIEGDSPITKEFEQSDMRYFLIPCAHCGHEQKLAWAGVKMDDSDPETARYECGSCKLPWTEKEKNDSVSRGRWEATKPFKGVAGFHINAFYSPWITIKEIAQEFVDAVATRDPEELQVVVNTLFGETFKVDNIMEKAGHEIANRVEFYDAPPPRSYLLTCSVDVQKDRLEYLVKAWGKGQESWAIEWAPIHGDPTGDDVWDRLDVILQSDFVREDRMQMRIKCTTVDSGHATDNVYRYVAKRFRWNVFAVKGKEGPRPVAKRTNPGKVKGEKRFAPLYIVGTDTSKDKIFAALDIEKHGPRYYHYPKSFDPEYFEQLTSEVKAEKFIRGQSITFYKKKREGDPNEALDLEVYNLGAFYIVDGPRLVERLAKKMAPMDEEAEPVEESAEVEEPKEKPKPKPKESRAQRMRRQLNLQRKGHRRRQW